MNRQYIGARYVPKFSDINDGVWDNSYTYEALEIVKYGNDTYTAKKPVPVGVDITNTEYWVLTGNYNGAIRNLDDRLTVAEGDIVDLKSDVERLDVHSVYNVKSYGAVGDGTTDDTDAIMLAVADANTYRGAVYFPTGRYKVTQPIIFTKDGCSIIGENMHATYIYSYHDLPAIQFNGLENDKLNGCAVRHIGIVNYGDNALRHNGIEFNFVVNSTIDDVVVNNYHGGILFNKAGNSFITRTGIVSDKTSAYGIDIKNNSSSSCVRDSYVGFFGNANTTGVGLIGHAGINDLLVEYLDVGNGGIGVYIDASNNGTSVPADIRLHEIVVDNCHQSGIEVNEITSRGNVLITGGWINPNIASGVKCINIRNSENIIITDVLMQQLSDSDNPTDTGIAGTNVKHLTVSNCHFMNLAAPISLVTLGDGLIQNNFMELYPNMTASNGIYIGTANNVNIINNRIVSFTNSILISAGARVLVSLNNLLNMSIASAVTSQLIANNIIAGTPTP